MKLRDFLPQSLMGRSLLILVVPVILAQIIAVTVFWDNHWDKMTKRLAYSVVGEITIITDQMDHNYSDELYEVLSAYLHKNLNIDMLYQKQVDLPIIQPEFTYVQRMIVYPLLFMLDNNLTNPHAVIYEDNNTLKVYVQVSHGLITFFVPESRLFSSSGYVFMTLLIGSSITLLVISILFLRNQIRPIRKLAAAASLMGKGRLVSLGPPKGAREVRQASEAFETMQRRIRRQIEQRTAMLAGVSHDLRTPLTRIKLGLSMLDDQEEAKNMLDDLDEMEKMVDAYLEFARGEKLEDSVSVDIVAFMEDIISHYQSKELNLTLETIVEKPEIFIQKVNFRRCVENLLSNAARYAQKVLITINKTDTRLYLIIEDNGGGIPEGQYEEALKPFVRLDSSRSKETGGAGLGLSVAMDIVLLHGGKLNLGKSENLGGLKVTIRLPL